MGNGAAARHLQEKAGSYTASAVEAVGDDPRRRRGGRASLGEQGAQRGHVVKFQLRKDTGHHGIVKRRQSHGAELTFPYLRYGKVRHLAAVSLGLNCSTSFFNNLRIREVESLLADPSACGTHRSST